MKFAIEVNFKKMDKEFSIMKSYLFNTHEIIRPKDDSVFRGLESNYSPHRTGGDSFSIIGIVKFQ